MLTKSQIETELYQILILPPDYDGAGSSQALPATVGEAYYYIMRLYASEYPDCICICPDGSISIEWDNYGKTKFLYKLIKTVRITPSLEIEERVLRDVGRGYELEQSRSFRLS